MGLAKKQASNEKKIKKKIHISEHAPRKMTTVRYKTAGHARSPCKKHEPSWRMMFRKQKKSKICFSRLEKRYPADIFKHKQPEWACFRQPDGNGSGGKTGNPDELDAWRLLHGAEKRGSWTLS